jgi:hypothetical protein
MRRFALICLLTACALAQEGHPLVGSWHGTWGPGPNAKDRSDVTVIMFWDGKTITGMLNPGPDAGKLQNASLDPNGWLVHFEGDVKDRSGAKVHVVADGKIENVTNLHRFIAGTWTQGATKGDFKITRDN